MTLDNNRFSVFLLEKDVLEYHNAKNKYNEYDEQYHSCTIESKDEYKQKKSYWYKKYISKMKYLEENYRKTNVYTQYHSQLEHGYVPNQENNCTSPPLAHAEVVEAMPVLPSVPTHNVLPSAPLQEEREIPESYATQWRQWNSS
tara:strand:+ start:184 stop:615 length:432 start_codon:yes stop_codon:yes gene_type:complete